MKGEIAYEGVSFAYPTREQQVLDNVTLSVRPGEKVAFVGSSGSGKSTLFQLLMRFYEPTAGRVTVDGMDVRELDPRSLHRGMSIGT
jgi:ATP-binding cassette subfamily B protein